MNIQTVTKQAYNVIVAGGGIAGVSAAVSAARNGASVLLLEKGVNLGGLATAGLISWYEPLCNGEGKQLIYGIAEELIRLATRCGMENLPVRWGGSGECKPRNERFSSFYSPTFFSLTLDAFVRESGASILFDTLATYPVMEQGHCTGVLVENANGREFYPADAIVDATGDASIMYRAGVPCVTGENFLTYIVHDMDRSSAERYCSDGDLTRFRRWVNCGSDYAGNGHPAGMKTFHGDSAEEITEYLLAGKQRMLQKYEGTDARDREILTIPSMPQFRTIRHIVGKAPFQGKQKPNGIPDSIGTVGDFRQAGPEYEVPFSCLYHPDFDNLLAAGRIVDVSDADAWEIARVIPVCALTGEAAGKAAAELALKKIALDR